MDSLAQLKAALADRYDIEREIGAGGMATVYLARDPKHDRHVALKLLKPELGAVLGVERFLAEIKVTANLQHPNLLPLFDSGEAGGLLFYVMPYVEGESLRARLDREKQLPVDEAIRIAVAVANALDYAHGHGVIHRDLKPENILLQHGQPVVADFGIALAVSNAGGNRITQTGLSLGTPQYMSPEQATGDRVIDGRSDIYSLAAVTYEMLTGEPPHIGNTAQAVIARVLTDKPRPIRSNRSAVPEQVEAALERALEKLPADRFSSAHEFAEALSGRGAAFTSGAARSHASAQPPARGWRARLTDPLVLGLALVAIAALAKLALTAGGDATPAPVVRYVVATPDSAPAFDNFPWPAAISPDGRMVVYSASQSAGTRTQLWLLRTDQVYAHPIPGTENAGQPMFSPDGSWLLFEANNKEMKVRLDGGSPVAVADGASYNGVDWTVNDEIVNGATGSVHGLSVYSASGGERTPLTHPDSANGELEHLWPIAFPDGKTVAFTVWKGGLTSAQIALARIPSGEITRLGLKGVRSLAVLDGMLVYAQADGAIMAVPVSGQRVSGKPVPVHDQVAVLQSNNGNSRIFVSRGGALVTGRGNVLSRLAWQDRNGDTHVITKQPAGFFGPRLSPDGARLAIGVSDGVQSDAWILDLRTGTLSRLTTSGTVSSVGWADANHVFFAGGGDSTRNGVWRQQATGAAPPELLYETSSLMPQASIAPDGRSIVVQMLFGNSWDIHRVALDSAPRTARPFVATDANETGPAFSPDGRWVTYSSDETGQFEAYVRSYPDPATKVQVSSGGAAAPVWSPDGRSVYYQSGTRIVEATLSTTPTLHVVSRDSVFSATVNVTLLAFTQTFEPTRDRNRMLTFVVDANRYQIVAVPNWLAEFRERVKPTTRK